MIKAGDALPAGTAAPTEAQTRVVQDAIRAFDAKQLQRAESLFSEAIATWEQLKRPSDERSELYKMRGNVLVDLKRWGPCCATRAVPCPAPQATFDAHRRAFASSTVSEFTRVDIRFKEAKADYDRVLTLMSDGEKPDGTARY